MSCETKVLEYINEIKFNLETIPMTLITRDGHNVVVEPDTKASNDIIAKLTNLYQNGITTKEAECLSDIINYNNLEEFPVELLTRKLYEPRRSKRIE